MNPARELTRWFSHIPLRRRVVIANLPLLLLWDLMFFWHLQPLFPILHPNEIWELALAVVGIAGTIFLNVWLVRLPFASLRDLSRTMDEVAAGNLCLRANHGLTHEELVDSCVRSFNVMLDKLERECQRSQSLADLVIVAQEEERKRIARDVHDQSCQLLATIGIRLEHLKRKILSSPGKPDGCLEELEQVKLLTQEALRDLRHLAFDLRPAVLEEMGLRGALSCLFKEKLEKHGFHLNMTWVGPETRLPEEIEISLYRVAQEAVTNIVKHSYARSVTVHLTFSEDRIKMRISDDGRGFDLERCRISGNQCIGIHGMKERASLISGEFRVYSSPGQGTSILVSVPVSRSSVIEESEAVEVGKEDDKSIAS